MKSDVFEIKVVSKTRWGRFLAGMGCVVMLCCSFAAAGKADPSGGNEIGPKVGALGEAAGGIPVRFHLDKPGYVTLVAEDPKTGRHIANLLSNTLLQAGDQKIIWDGYDSGSEVRGTGWVQKRVAPGEYRLSALVHDAIHLRYEFPVYSPGTPPWKTADRAGAWLADHSSPSAVIYLPPGSGSPYGPVDQGQMLLGATVGEAGYPLLWTDLDGKPLHGAKIRGWMGAKSLARDIGSAHNQLFYAYTAFTTNRSTNGSIDPEFHQNGALELDGIKADPRNPFVTIWKHDPVKPTPFDGYHSPVSLSVFNGIAVVSSDLDDKLFFIDVKAKKEIGSVDLAAPRGVAWDAQGRLYAISNGAVLRYNAVQPRESKLGEGTVIVSADKLEDPRQLLVSEADRHLYVSQWGGSHQVKAFDCLTGAFLKAFGHPGGPQVGPYDDRRMHYPSQLALAPLGSGGTGLWVMEDDFVPKRVSVWRTGDGALAKAFYGPPQYSGGGTLDPEDPTRLFYASDFNFGSHGGMLFKIDWKTGAATLSDIYTLGAKPRRDDASSSFQGEFQMPLPYDCLPEDHIPERPVHINGQTYLISSYDSSERSNGPGSIWKFDEKTGIAWPIAYVGGGTFWMQRFFAGSRGIARATANKAAGQRILAELKKQGGDWADAFLTWSDLNGNHRTDPDEWTIRVFPRSDTAFQTRTGGNDRVRYFSGASLSCTDLSYTGGWAVHVPAPRFTASGVPVYDISKATFELPPQPEFRSPIDGDVSYRFDSAPNGWLVQWPSYGWKNGVLQWTYPVSDQRRPPSGPGDMEAVNRLMGPLVTPTAGDAGPIAFLDGDKGAIYLMTVDGFFVQTLGGDVRTAPLMRLPSAQRGMLMDGYSFDDEHWHATVTQFTDGRICLTAGKEYIGVFTVEGLNSVRRVDFKTVAVRPDQVAQLSEKRVIAAPLPKSSPPSRKMLAVVCRPSARTADGDLAAWPSDTQWVAIGGRGRAAICVRGDQLCAAWKTSDPNALNNAGGQFPFLFKYGGALDLMISTKSSSPQSRGNAPQEGDLRLLVTRVAGRVRAVLYHPVDLRASQLDQVTFASPIGKEIFASVKDVSDQVILAQRGGDYEISVPLKLLDLVGNKLPGNALLGDIGLLRGQSGQTVERVYWSNNDTAVLSDVPTEARLQPSNWGELHFAAGQP